MHESIETDLLIIGGGINGTGIAADAAGRGLKVTLCEMNDLASATSSWSSKLIHGGLRYLEQFNFKLVRESLHEREVLMRKAPHIIRPINFVIPHNKQQRPAWMIRFGLFLYDHLSHRTTLPNSKRLDLHYDTTGFPLKNKFRVGFSYPDCQTDDARLVILNALAAKTHGATILPYTKCVNTATQNHEWLCELQSHTRKNLFIKAKAVVNATGPWADRVLQDIFNLDSPYAIRQVQGSHIVVPKLYTGSHAYLLQVDDQRVVFVVPFQQAFTLIGTTEIEHQGSPTDAKITQQEIQYLCEVVSLYFTKPVSPDDVIWAFSGVRPLFQSETGNLSKISRDYKLELREEPAPLITVFGGKLTTFRTLAEHAVNMLKPFFPQLGSEWTASAALPGGNLGTTLLNDFLQEQYARYPWIPQPMINRLVHSYGTIMHEIIDDANSFESLGIHFGADLFEREIIYLIKHEWAQNAEDIVWRRSKLGLHLNTNEIEKINEYCAKAN